MDGAHGTYVGWESRRGFLGRSAAASLAAAGLSGRGFAGEGEDPFFQTRGVVLVPSDITTWDWPEQARRAHLSTIATHVFPHQVAAFVATDEGRRFLERCAVLGVQVEHELHSMADLLPRELFGKSPEMFRMDEKGDRRADANLCVHSPAAIEVVLGNARRYTELLRSTTSRYFYWIDDARPMCRCPKCRGLSDSDQALVLENAMLGAIREVDARATLAHLAYANTYPAPKDVKPSPGIFLEFAPIHRNYDVPLRQRESRFGGYTHGQLLDHLDANLEVFGRSGAQALEYWLDESRFLRHMPQPRPERVKIPWSRSVFRADLETYASRGIRHVTTFAVQVDGSYVRLFGPPPLAEYGAELQDYRRG
jgi:hypothetical protein